MYKGRIINIIGKEAAESLRNRWFIFYTVCFVALALLVLLLGSSGNELLGFSGFGKTAASLINLVLLFVPVIALVNGGICIASERENGTLSYLLTHPVTKSEVFLGKFIGILLAILFSVLLGFGLAGLGVSIMGGGGDVSKFLITAMLSSLLAASFLSVGMLVSVYSNRTSKAIGISIFLWLFFIVLGDLGIMGTAAVTELGVNQLFTLAVINPAQVFKIASVLVLSPRFEILGPVGIYGIRTFGEQGLFYLLLAILLLWAVFPLFIAYFTFCRFRREEL